MELRAFLTHRFSGTSPPARGWHDEAVPDVSIEIAKATSDAVARELASRAALNGRLTNTITVCGALLVAAFALSRSATDLRISGAADTWFSIVFATAVALLVAAILVCVAAIAPDWRHRLNPQLAKYWARQSVSDGEVRTDCFKIDVALLDQLAVGNGRRARWLIGGQLLLAGALVAAAAGAAILFFACQRTKTTTPRAAVVAKAATPGVRAPARVAGRARHQP